MPIQEITQAMTEQEARAIENSNFAETFVAINSIQNPNLLINPDFVINQRGLTSYAGNTTYTFDRWCSNRSTVTRESNTSPAICAYQAKVVCRVDGSTWIAQILEDFGRYVGKSLTVRFWAKAVGALSSLSVIVGKEYKAIALSTSWREYTLTYTNIQWDDTYFLHNGVAFQGQGGTIAIGQGFYIAAPQLIAGNYAGEFRIPNPAVELSKCQRFFEKSYDVATKPGTATYNGIVFVPRIGTSTDKITPYSQSIPFSARKRIRPEITLYSQKGTINKISKSGIVDVAATVSNKGDGSFYILCSEEVNQNDNLYFHWTAEAEIYGFEN